MFKRILVPTDGSERAEHAARAAIELARFLQAEIVALYVYQSLSAINTSPFTVKPLPISEETYATIQRATAEKILSLVDAAAQEAGVRCTSLAVENESAARAIVSVAESSETPCDLVFIGAHGRGVVAQSILGSVTTKVQSLCTIPVLVYRDGSASASKAKRKAKASVAAKTTSINKVVEKVTKKKSLAK
jgi:nucleotide-binding universal stress UspA family protein